MKLSSRGKYALLALFDLAFFAQGRLLQVKEIAPRQGIPSRFLEQIFQDLKRAGLVLAKRGPHGGYQLAREPRAIALAEIIEAVEGKLDLSAANDESFPGEPGMRAIAARPMGLRSLDWASSGERVVKGVLEDVSAELRGVLAEHSLQSFIDRAIAEGLKANLEDTIDYVI